MAADSRQGGGGRRRRGRSPLPPPLLVAILLMLQAASLPLVSGSQTPTPSKPADTSSGGKLDPGYVPDNKPGPLLPEKVDIVKQKDDTNNINDDDGGGKDKGGNKPRSLNTSAPLCELWAKDPAIYAKISALVSAGAKLLEYNLIFPEYETNPLRQNMSNNFLTSRWSRAFTHHGKTLLSLSFNYRVLSLSMLSFGVERVPVDIVDAPKGCFGKFTPEQKLKKIMEVVMSDFRMAHEDRQWMGEFDYACHQVVEDDDGVADFKYSCCERLDAGHNIHCTEDLSVKWITLMFTLIVTLKITAFLAGPLFLNHWVYSESLKQSDYIVKLKDPMMKSILVKKVKVPCDNSGGTDSEMKQFSKFREIVKRIISEKINYVSFRKLQVQIDHRRLMTEKSVPVGLFSFLYDNLIWCGIRRWEPFLSCCKESIFGSWSPRFLWIKLRKRSDCNTSCKKYCSWEHVFNLLGGLLLLLAIPIPYYIRVGIYYAYEEAEVRARKEVIKDLGLKYPWEHTLIHYADPSHAGMVMLYITYALSFILLAAFRSCNASKFDPIAVGAVCDMRNVNRVECFRLMLAHLILPFEKFGICGIVVAAVYWPIALPICLVVTVCYSTPTLYLLGRFLIHHRPTFLRNTPIPTSPNHYRHKSKSRHTLSQGTTSFETCLLLENISPENEKATNEGCCRCEFNRQACYTAFLSVIVGLLCSVFMLSVLILFADVLGFIVEVFVFTLMGAIVNASSAAKYLMLSFWIMVYSSSCFNNVYNKYMDLNDHLFKFIKAKLKEDIKAVTMLREDMQKNTAFKYFNQKDFHELRDMEIEEELDSDFEAEGDRDKMLGNYHGYGMDVGDSIEYIDDRLHWRVHSMVLFVDNGDVPRIPKTLFHEICKLNAPGCPGPIHLSLLKAFKQLSYMVVFIIFVIITVMAFGDVYKISSTNQLLVTLAGGFLPFVVRFVIKPKAHSIDLNSYSFEGKIHQIIYKFNEVWPVYDLSFKVERMEEPCPNADGDIPGHSHGGGGDQTDPPAGPPPGAFIGYQPYIQGPECAGSCGEPSHVDLLITIRDDTDVDENLHQEPGSFGSRGSLPPADNSTAIQVPPRASPEAEPPGSSTPNASNARAANPSNAANPTNVANPSNVANPTNAAARAAFYNPDRRPIDTHRDTHRDPQRETNRDSPRDTHRDSPRDSNKGPPTQSGGLSYLELYGDPSAYREPSAFHTTETQTGFDTPISRNWARPSYASASTQVMTPPGAPGAPGGRPVDLMVDLTHGGIRVRNQTGQDGPGPENGTAMWNKGSPYKRVPSVPSKDESSV